MANTEAKFQIDKPGRKFPSELSNELRNIYNELIKILF